MINQAPAESGKNIHDYIHNIKTSLQSLMVANELVMEGQEKGLTNKRLLETMMSDIKRINDTVNFMEKDFGGDEYGS